MKNELKLKNAVYPIIYLAVFLSVFIGLFSSMAILLPMFLDNDTKYLKNIIIIGILLILILWSITFISMLFCKKIVITETEIKAYRWKNLKWVIQKEQIIECIYTKSAWYKYIFPLESFNMFALQFKLYGEGISSIYCLALSYKQLKKIKENFDYPIRIIGTIREQ